MKLVYGLIIAIVAAGVAALTVSGGNHPRDAAAPESTANPAKPAGAVPEPSAAEEAEIVAGQVLEKIDVPQYTYMRVGAPGSEGTWVAVSTAKLEVGQRVRVRAETTMTDFESPSLKRTFASIRFGTLDTGSAEAENPHENELGDVNAGHAAPSAASDVTVGKVDKASGPNGRRIAEIYAERSKLSGKPVRVRGVVVKVVSGVLGKNFVHLRDGSGAEQTKNFDLTVTMGQVPEKGQTILVEGQLVVDKDIGAGYRYDVLLEDARSAQ